MHPIQLSDIAYGKLKEEGRSSEHALKLILCSLLKVCYALS